MKKAIERIRTFNQEREWEQFHTPENLAKSIMIEAGELLECFQWSNEFDRQAVKEELADVMTYCIDMADALKVDLEEIILEKMDQNEAKYPVEKARGNSKKYDEF
ncbi:MAG: nucleotide pyrophosphohydrolase [Erysipelotrichaceae bacterium]|nr:nucleotide pyrophosphohydrolase [Erysipelotrichaceae bacterium]